MKYKKILKILDSIKYIIGQAVFLIFIAMFVTNCAITYALALLVVPEAKKPIMLLVNIMPWWISLGVCYLVLSLIINSCSHKDEKTNK